MARTIHPEMWLDKKIRSLPIEEKLLWVYLLTNEHTHISGLYRLAIPYIIYETGIPSKGVQGGLEALEKLGLIEYDYENDLVWIRKFIRRQKGITEKNVNAFKSIDSQLEKFCDSPLIFSFCNEYSDLELKFKAPSKPPDRGLGRDLDKDKDKDKDSKTKSNNIQSPKVYSEEAVRIGTDFFEFVNSRVTNPQIKLDQQIEAADKLIKKHTVEKLELVINTIKKDDREDFNYFKAVKSLLKLEKVGRNMSQRWIDHIYDEVSKNSNPFKEIDPTTCIYIPNNLYLNMTEMYDGLKFQGITQSQIKQRLEDLAKRFYKFWSGEARYHEDLDFLQKAYKDGRWEKLKNGWKNYEVDINVKELP